LGRDVEMCSGKKKAMAEAKAQKKYSLFKERFVGLACIRHQHQRCVPIPFFAEPAEKFHARAGKKRKKERKEKNPNAVLLKLGSSRADDVF
jgi:hypothetical protein